jgi:hypothetical protein
MKLEEAKLDFVDLSGGTFEGRAFEHKKESTVRNPRIHCITGAKK